MIKEYREEIDAGFKGTVIDIETIGYFKEEYRNTGDRREFEEIQPVIFGYINGSGLHILYVTAKSEIPELNEKVAGIIGKFEKPFYAFNTSFEENVLSIQLEKEITFECELQKAKFEAKARAVKELGISNYDDPFNDKGILCMHAWQKGEFDKAVAHNRACLLKERDILLKRGYRNPDGLALFTK